MMATNFRGKIGEIGCRIFVALFVTLAFRNGLEYRNASVNSAMNLATSYC